MSAAAEWLDVESEGLLLMCWHPIRTESPLDKSAH